MTEPPRGTVKKVRRAEKRGCLAVLLDGDTTPTRICEANLRKAEGIRWVAFLWAGPRLYHCYFECPAKATSAPSPTTTDDHPDS